MSKQFPATIAGFPLENVDPLEKRKKWWLLQYARAALSQYNSLSDRTIGWRSRGRYDEIRAYSQARQSIKKYLDILAPDIDNDNNGLNQLVVDRNIIPVIPKVRRDVISLLTKANENYYVTIDPVDPLAATEIEKEAADLKARVVMRQTLQNAGAGQLAKAPAIAPQPNEPNDLEGAEVATLGLRHKVAMKAELIVQQILSSNKYDDLREWIGADLCDFGVAVVKDDMYGCNVSLRKVDMRGFVTSPSIAPDFSDSIYRGEIHEINVSQVVADSNGQITEEELKKVYEMGNNNGNGAPVFYNVSADWNGTFRQGRVQVLDLEIKSTDTETCEERKNKYGNLIFGKAPYGTKSTDKKKVITKKCQNIYRVKWIVGTEIVYDLGTAKNQKLDPKNESRAQFSYTIVSGDVHDMVAYSRTEALISFADAIQLRRMKMENLFNTAIPPGHIVDLSALEAIAIDAGGTIMTPKDIYAMLVTRGILLYRSEDLVGDGKINPPMMPINSEITGILTEYWNDIQRQLDMMNRSIGLNEVTDGSAADPKRSNPATAAAITGTNNALADLFSADRRLMIAVSESVLIRAQTMVRLGMGEEFISSLGGATVSFLKAAPTIDRYRFGFTITDRPSPEQIQAFEEELQKAVISGQLGIDDVAVVRSIRNIKERQAYLVYKVRKNKEEQQQNALQQQQQTGQLQQQSAQVTAQAAQETLKLEYQLKSELSKQEHLQKMDEETLRVLGKNEDNRIAGTGRVDAALVQAKAKDESSIRQANTKLIEVGMEDKTPLVNIPAELKTAIDPLTSAQQPLVPGIQQLQQQHFSFLTPPAKNQPPQDEPETAQEQQTETPEDEQAEVPEAGAEPSEQGEPVDNPEEEGAEQPSKEQLMQMLNG